MAQHPAAMSKSSPKPHVSDPYAPQQSSSGTKPAKFYDGPTVSQNVEKIKDKAVEVKDKAKSSAKEGAAVVKIQANKAIATVRRHPLSFGSLLSTVPVLIFLSLLSVVFCPPPPAPPSTFSKIALSPFGLHKSDSPYSELHQTLCYPSNVYHREFLEPYIYPRLEYSKNKIISHPIFVKGVQPTFEVVRSTSSEIWEGPLRPVFKRIDRGARKFYLTFVEPHLPYLKRRFLTLTDPATTRVVNGWNENVAPRLVVVRREVEIWWRKVVVLGRKIAQHPVSRNAAVLTDRTSKIVSARAKSAYAWGRPRAIKIVQEAEKVTREVLGPRVIKGLDVAAQKAVKAWAVLKVRVAHLYSVHLEPHVGPHLKTVSTAISPYVSAFNAKVYTPYLFPIVNYYFPTVPEKPTTFWSLIADKLPGLSNIADSKSGYASPPVTGHKPKTKQPDGKDKITRDEMEKIRAAIKEKIANQGKKGYEKVQEELVKQNTEWLNVEIPKMRKLAQDTLDREITYLLTGLDRLYTSSPTLTREQVRESSETSDRKVAQKLATLKSNIETRRSALMDKGKPVVREGMEALDRIIQTDAEDLKMKMSWMDDATAKDWSKFNSLREDSQAWQTKYKALHKGTSNNKQLKVLFTDIAKNIALLNTELDDKFAGFRSRMETLTRSGLDRIEAREALAEVSKSKSASSSTTSSASSRVSILPIEEIGAAAVGAAGIIGKGKDQVIDALSQASSAALGQTSTASGVVASAKSIGSELSAYASSVYDAASSSVHQATRSAIYAAGATPSPESVGEHVDSVVRVVSESANSLVSAASESASSIGSVISNSASSLASEASLSVHHASRSVISAVGATPSPESLGEHIESVVDVASKSAESLASVASASYHSATRAASRAVGVTPTPESVGEHVESVLDAGSSIVSAATESVVSFAAEATNSAVSLASAVTESAASLASIASASASSLASEASASIHSATRSALSALGATPTPETPSEHLESIANLVAQGAASVYSGVNDATRSIKSAVGATPSPESPLEHLESVGQQASSSVSSLVSVVSASAESIVSAALEGVHSGTRSLSSLVGATPTPETPGEHLESIFGEASKTLIAPAESQVALLASSISSLLGYEPTATPLVSAASSYLSALSAGGVSQGEEVYEKGSSILASLQSEVGKSVHSATRAVSRAAGATPSPESFEEYVEDVKAKFERVFARDEL